MSASAGIGDYLPFDGYASGFKDNIVVAYDGLPFRDMTQTQHELFINLIELYTDRLPADTHSGVSMNKAIFGYIQSLRTGN